SRAHSHRQSAHNSSPFPEWPGLPRPPPLHPQTPAVSPSVTPSLAMLTHASCESLISPVKWLASSMFSIGVHRPAPDRIVYDDCAAQSPNVVAARRLPSGN